MIAYGITITILQTAWKSDDKWLRYSDIGSKFTNMLEFTSQSIAGIFPPSQELWNTPSQVCSVAACGWAYILLRFFRGHLRWSAMLLEPQNRRKMTHFIATCGRALRRGARVGACWQWNHLQSSLMLFSWPRPCRGESASIRPCLDYIKRAQIIGALHFQHPQQNALKLPFLKHCSRFEIIPQKRLYSVLRFNTFYLI